MKAGKLIACGLALVPVLVAGQCVYQEQSQRNGLESLCRKTGVGASLAAFVHEAAATPRFKVRTGGPAGKNADEWFDREYLRIGERLQKGRKTTDDYTVAFAKPGVGYYACIVAHRDGKVSASWFEDKSS